MLRMFSIKELADSRYLLFLDSFLYKRKPQNKKEAFRKSLKKGLNFSSRAFCRIGNGNRWLGSAYQVN